MTTFIKSLAAAVAILGASAGTALASPGGFPVPEPGSLALVGVAIAAAIYALRRKK
jgi:hypothetical protein